MKTKTIIINRNKGEIGNLEEFEHIFSGGKITKITSKENNIYYLDIHFLQEESNTHFRVEKYFENEDDTINYLKKFISVNPTSEAIIKKISEVEILHYC